MRPSSVALASSPGPLTPPPLRRDSPATNALASSSVSSLPTPSYNDGFSLGGGGTPVGFDEFAASDEDDTDDTDEGDEGDEEDRDGGGRGGSPAVLSRMARNAARLHAAAIASGVVPDVSRELAIP